MCSFVSSSGCCSVCSVGEMTGGFKGKSCGREGGKDVCVTIAGGATAAAGRGAATDNIDVATVTVGGTMVPWDDDVRVRFWAVSSSSSRWRFFPMILLGDDEFMVVFVYEVGDYLGGGAVVDCMVLIITKIPQRSTSRIEWMIVRT